MAVNETVAAISKMKALLSGAWAQEQGKEVDLSKKGFGGLPADIVNETAQLSSFAIKTDRNQKPYVVLTFIAITPEKYRGTRQPKNYFFAGNQFKSSDDQFHDFCNDLRLMEAPIDQYPGDQLWKSLAGVLQGLVDAAPFIKYRTSGINRDDGSVMVHFSIEKLDEAFVWEGDDPTIVPDEPPFEEAAAEPEPEPVKAKPVVAKPATKSAVKPVVKPAIAKPAPVAAKPVVAKPAAPKPAAKPVVGKPKPAPVPVPEPEPEPEPEATEEGVELAVGQIFGYQPTPRSTIEEYAVTDIQEEEQTVTLQRVRDDKVFEEVAWESLQVQGE